jgi:2-keto-3-deoxy-6-phosphogluconate aldolase
MDHLHATYRKIHEQGFLPIFVEDGLDSKLLVEACVMAGCKGLEYTLRRHDAHIMIPWIRENYPDLILLVGSTLDGNSIVEQARLSHPQMLTLDELASIGVDGFVSMVGFREETISKYSSTHLIFAPSSTLREAFVALEAGAQFVKMMGPELDLVRQCRSDAVFGLCPVMMTGGMYLERIPEAVEAGAVVIGTGFDLVLKQSSRNPSAKEISESLKRYIETTCQARDQKWPKLAKSRDSDFSSWLLTLPHYHPFSKNGSTIPAIHVSQDLA